MDLDRLRFPVGKFQPGEIHFEEIASWVKELEEFPALLSSVVAGIEDKALSYTYRPGGWNIRQVVHHLADSHMNAFIRCKLTLTEDNPTIRPYFEGLWAEQPDVSLVPVDMSIRILEGVHARWVTLFRSCSIHDYTRRYTHPEHGKQFDLSITSGMYAWHGRHHLSQIKNALQFQKVRWE